jgi:hypothetical protein
MTDYITTKDTAKLVRAALKSEYPGTKFSVRMSTGTASAWMNVSWSDGPTDAEVTTITSRFEGRKFNGMTDGYDNADTVLIASETGDMPREVQYVCDGINTHRHYTAAGYAVAQQLISTDSDHTELVIFTPEGVAIAGATLPTDIYVAGHFHDYIYSPENIARSILHHVNIAAATVASR